MPAEMVARRIPSFRSTFQPQFVVDLICSFCAVTERTVGGGRLPELSLSREAICVILCINHRMNNRMQKQNYTKRQWLFM